MAEKDEIPKVTQELVGKLSLWKWKPNPHLVALYSGAMDYTRTRNLVPRIGDEQPKNL